MRKRTLLLGLVLLASTFAEGCCWCGQPGPIRRWWNGGCCATCYAPCGAGCATCGAECGGGCGCGGTVYDRYGPPTGNPGAPNMPNSTPLTRTQYGPPQYVAPQYAGPQYPAAQYPAGQYPVR
jgi:hypothetical protein